GASPRAKLADVVIQRPDDLELAAIALMVMVLLMKSPHVVAFLAIASLPGLVRALGAQEWPGYGGGPENMRYSSLTQINRDNVKRLQVAWTFDASDGTVGTELEVNPIVVHGVLYAPTASLNVVALNAATGELVWRFDPYNGRH